MLRPHTLTRLAFAALLLQSAGCEIAALAIVAGDEPEPYEFVTSEFCTKLASSSFFYERGLETGGGSTVRSRGTMPSFRLAKSDDIILYIARPSLGSSDGDPRERIDVEVEGAFANVEWDACSPQELAVVLHATEVGLGTVRLLDDGIPLDEIDFQIVEPTGMNVTFRPKESIIEASLFDDEGADIYSDEIVWEAVPSTSAHQAIGNMLAMTFGYTENETYIVASHGALSASLTLVVDPTTGSLREK